MRSLGAWPFGAACQGEGLFLPVASPWLPLCKSNEAAGLPGSRVLPASLAEGWRWELSFWLKPSSVLESTGQGWVLDNQAGGLRVPSLHTGPGALGPPMGLLS